MVQISPFVRPARTVPTPVDRTYKKALPEQTAASVEALGNSLLGRTRRSGLRRDSGRAAAPEPTLAPLINESAPNRIPGQYIVVFKQGVARDAVLNAQERIKGLGGTIGHTYTSAVSGFSVKLPPEALNALRALPDVAYIEVDQVGDLNTIQPPNPPTAPPTGIDRIDRRLLPLNNTYTYSETGAGVHVYVIDTGIRASHTEFGGRVSGGVNTMAAASGTDDCHGHGTHVAGTIGGANFGVAKGVFLHPVRAGDCANTYLAPIIAAVDWVTANRILPAVVNLSSGFSGSPTLDTAVANSVASGVTYAVAAGNANADACNTSPARAPAAITVGAVDPANDTRAGFSNFGTCLDLFAPGVNILSAGIASNTATATMSGTSMAAPHVAGVAARHLETHPADTPAQVWTAIHNADDAAGTPVWGAGPGVINPGTGSPNELLHWGSLNDGFNDGDPHITTVDGVHYDFQSAGEFVALRGEGLEIQTRQTPIATTFIPGPNPYTGLATCVSLNTAVAARVGTHRVSYQPNISGVPDPSGLQLRVDGALTTLGAHGLDLGSGGRIGKSAVGDGIEIDFPNETKLVVTPGWWESQGKWYLNVAAYHSPAAEGIMGEIANGSWLPALPDGTSLGPKPTALHDRYVDLYGKFADAWRVADAKSLFDYAPGTSSATFTLGVWPKESPSSCVIPEAPLAPPLDARVAEKQCSAIVAKNRKADCIFDVMVTGNAGFAQTYLQTQQLQPGATETTVKGDKDPTKYGESVTFTATVVPTVTRGGGAPAGTVQFILDGSNAGNPVTLDSNGRAAWSTSSL